eukprot:346335-Alexandrium_andersonii.AAC.1
MTRENSMSVASGLPRAHTGPAGRSRRTAARPGPAGVHVAWPDAGEAAAAALVGAAAAAGAAVAGPPAGWEP